MPDENQADTKTKADVSYEIDMWPTSIEELHRLGHLKTGAPGSPRSVYLEGRRGGADEASDPSPD